MQQQEYRDVASHDNAQVLGAEHQHTTLCAHQIRHYPMSAEQTEKAKCDPEQGH